MSALIAILVLLLLGLVIFVVSAPLRVGRRSGDLDAGASASTEADRRAALASGIAHDELESAREAKYREIRDAEMDFRTGKLSKEDYEAIDVQLRAEALEILNHLQDGDADPVADPSSGPLGSPSRGELGGAGARS